MEMKEFYYHDGIRVSLFNLDHKAVPFHSHKTVSDIIFCSKGTINIELPELGKIYKVPKGSAFQIPSSTKHRFANGEPEGVHSRYVLMQLGSFDIDFVKDTAGMQELLSDISAEHGTGAPIYIEDRKSDILGVASHFSKERPTELTEEENKDVIKALEFFACEGRQSAFPD